MNSEVNSQVTPGVNIQMQYIYSGTTISQDTAENVRHAVRLTSIMELLEKNNYVLTKHDIIKLLKNDGADFIENSLRISSEGSFFQVSDDWKYGVPQNGNSCLLLFWIQGQNSALQARLNELSEALSKLDQKIDNLRPGPSHEESKTSHPDSRRLDIAIVDSEPLVKIDQFGRVPIGESAHESSYQEIPNLLEAQGKSINLHFDIASLQNFVNVLSLSPSVLHIMCNGDMNRSTGKFFLSFERDGALHELYTEDLKAILQEINFKTKLVFVNSCHSENVAQVFIDAGVPCVVAVQSESKVSLLAAKKFAEVFYKQLFEGKSIENAFKYAKAAIQAEQVTTCCCAHSHKKDCQWYKLAKQEGFEKAHNLHTPTCIQCFNKLGHKNLHRENCVWAMEFLVSVCENFDVPTGDIDVCCCSPELPHDEAMKFKLIYQEKKFAEQVLFENMEEGKVKITSRHSSGDQKFSVKNLPDSNKELYEIISKLNDPDNKVVELYGVEGIGKTTLAKQAANYMVLRDMFLKERVHYIKLDKITNTKDFRLRLFEEAPGTVDLRSFCESIKDSRTLFILDNSDELLKEDMENFRHDLAYITEFAPNVKFLIITLTMTNLKMIGKAQVEIRLSKMQAAKLLCKNAYAYLNIQERAVYQLVEHEIFDLISLTPQAIWFVTEKLRHGKNLDETARELSLEKH